MKTKNAHWQRKPDKLILELEFDDFAEGFSFLTEVASLAEKASHHPDIWQSWNKVKLELSTHSEGKITEKDEQLAGEILEILK